MDPDTLADIMEAVTDCALACGMDPDVATITIAFDAKTGDAKVSSTSGSGKSFELAVPAADIAAALDADMTEEAPADAPPVGEVPA